MDSYFCYIHRDAKAVAELKVLTPENEAGLELELTRLRADYPGSRFEIFHGDQLVATIDKDGMASGPIWRTGA
jgi:hypothetical protein